MPPEAVLLFALDVVCRPHDQLILNQPTDRHVMELLQNKGETLDQKRTDVVLFAATTAGNKAEQGPSPI